MKEREKIIEFPQYGYKISFIETNNIIISRKNRDHILGEFKEDSNNKFINGLSSDIEYFSFIFLNRNPDINTLVHECYHSICKMFRWINAKDVDEEIFAYTLGYLVEKACKFYKNK